MGESRLKAGKCFSGHKCYLCEKWVHYGDDIAIYRDKRDNRHQVHLECYYKIHPEEKESLEPVVEEEERESGDVRKTTAHKAARSPPPPQKESKDIWEEKWCPILNTRCMEEGCRWWSKVSKMCAIQIIAEHVGK